MNNFLLINASDEKRNLQANVLADSYQEYSKSYTNLSGIVNLGKFWQKYSGLSNSKHVARSYLFSKKF